MTEDQYNTFELIMRLFGDRDEDYDETTSIIFATIKYPLLDAVTDILELEENQVNWLTINLNDTALIIECALEYKALDDVPDFIDTLFPSNKGKLSKNVTIGIPLSLVVEPKETVCAFLQNTISNALDKKQPTKAKLTTDQELMVFMSQSHSLKRVN